MPAKERKTLGRGKSFAQALAEVRKDTPVGSFDELLVETEAISTGNLLIDHALGVGGLPRGRLIEIYGMEASGKTTLALQTAGRAQAEGLNVLYIDFENSLDPNYAKALGLDLFDESFLLTQPETFEAGMNAVRKLVASGEIGMVVVDSVGAASIAKELAIETGESTFADKAKLMAQSMRQLTGIVNETKTCLVFLNHLQEVIASGGHPGIKRTTTPGGRALKFHASVRIECTVVKSVKGKVYNPLTNRTEEMFTQRRVKVYIAKNKVAMPYRSVETVVRLGKGFSQAHAILEVLVAYGDVKTKAGGYYIMPTGEQVQGEPAAVAHIEDGLGIYEEEALKRVAEIEEKDTSLVVLEEDQEKPEVEDAELDAILAGD